MRRDNVKKSIGDYFQNTVRGSSGRGSAFLLVDSEKLSFHLNMAEGISGNTSVIPEQPYYIASVGKLFTSVLVSILCEKGKLSFDDKIVNFLDQELLKNLHVYKGQEYTDEIEIKHLLNHTSGLPDHFYPLLDNLLENPDFDITPKEVVKWTKQNLKPYGPPGNKLNYSDTNYHLVGLIIESVVGSSFHEMLKEFIFEPLEMKHSSILHHSTFLEKPQYPVADFYYKDTKLTDLKGYANIDYAGGGVVSTSEDLLKFMKALVNHQLIRNETFEKMGDWAKFQMGIAYGYGLMKLKRIPLVMPYMFWGHSGATGSFMFYQPDLEAYLIGTFNDFKYETKGTRFMVRVNSKLAKAD